VRNLRPTSAALLCLKHPARLTNLPKFAISQLCLQRFSDSGGRLGASKSDFFHSYFLLLTKFLRFRAHSDYDAFDCSFESVRVLNSILITVVV